MIKRVDKNGTINEQREKNGYNREEMQEMNES